MRRTFKGNVQMLKRIFLVFLFTLSFGAAATQAKAQESPKGPRTPSQTTVDSPVKYSPGYLRFYQEALNQCSDLVRKVGAERGFPPPCDMGLQACLNANFRCQKNIGKCEATRLPDGTRDIHCEKPATDCTTELVEFVENYFTATPDGCGPANGNVFAPACGNQVTEIGEDCDIGADNGKPSSSCNARCRTPGTPDEDPIVPEATSMNQNADPLVSASGGCQMMTGEVTSGNGSMALVFIMGMGTLLGLRFRKKTSWLFVIALCFVNLSACSPASEGANTPASTGVGNNAQNPTPNVNQTPVVWVPDYYGQKVEVRIGEGPSTKSVTLALTACNPNSVAVSNDKLYVVCNKDALNGDKILAYDAVSIRNAPAGATANPPAEKTILSAEFNSLIGMAFDAQKNLWVASYANNEILRISAASLSSAAPVVEKNLVDTPALPVALAFDKDGSLWVTGQFMGGILLNVPESEFGKKAGAIPRSCFSNSIAGCQKQAGLFKDVEGLALYDGKIWVSNNGGNTPGRELISFTVDNAGALTVAGVFGSQALKTGPFLCPGGLFAGGQHLWINDQGYGKADTTCGATDPGSAVGAVLRFTPDLLNTQSTDANQIARFNNITSRPGFGGIFVEAE